VYVQPGVLTSTSIPVCELAFETGREVQKPKQTILVASIMIKIEPGSTIGMDGLLPHRARPWLHTLCTQPQKEQKLTNKQPTLDWVRPPACIPPNRTQDPRTTRLQALTVKIRTYSVTCNCNGRLRIGTPHSQVYSTQSHQWNTVLLTVQLSRGLESCTPYK
jgi:hypothetical protein